MERLTKRNPLSGEIERNGLPQQLYKKLYEYENAEEQGLLLRLPCKVGQRVFKIEYVINKQYKGCNCSCLADYGQYEACPYYDEEIEDCTNILNENSRYQIIATKFDYGLILEFNSREYINTGVYLTKQEAEAKLKEVEGG